MIKKIVAILLVLLSAACSNRQPDVQDLSAGAPASQNGEPDSGEGRRYIQALAAAIERSDRIVVTEHSNAYDVLDQTTQPQLPDDYRPLVYRTHEMNAGERANFLNLVKKMTVATQDAEAACTFEPHHTIAFFSANKQTSAMQICFRCGQVEWEGSANRRPWSLAPTLKTVIAGVGMKEERDWYALAKTAAK